jgi:hypothetical protein
VGCQKRPAVCVLKKFSQNGILQTIYPIFKSASKVNQVILASLHEELAHPGLSLVLTKMAIMTALALKNTAYPICHSSYMYFSCLNWLN